MALRRSGSVTGNPFITPDGAHRTHSYRLMDASVDLYGRLVAGGAQAVGASSRGLAKGAPADWVVLNRDHPALMGLEGEAVLQRLIFAGSSNPVRDVMIGGEWVVRDGDHAEEESVLDAYRDAIGQIEV